MKIYVDADACPVKEIIIEESKSFDIPVVLVKSFSHYSNKIEDAQVETVYVDAGADSADYRILQLANKGDLVVTQDYGLASLALGKGCIALHHKGFAYTPKNMDDLLLSRHLSAKARKSGVKTKGPKPLTNEDRNKFRHLLVQTLEHVTKKET
ncbi:YaiI/YqxD family protein [Salirhabdus sp. Marseille-P4669]|uniref:YaiI/YqxD family protein n=1 Tax=Salirhabdus sp. Marseille-P4669 TaxID=2042310 RepID=UPI000C7A9DAE|nr:YaiI/YqxD family protein [Salirhabdus sp. Marseille-P4669]